MRRKLATSVGDERRISFEGEKEFWRRKERERAKYSIEAKLQLCILEPPAFCDRVTLQLAIALIIVASRATWFDNLSTFTYSRSFLSRSQREEKRRISNAEMLAFPANHRRDPRVTGAPLPPTFPLITTRERELLTVLLSSNSHCKFVHV